MYVRRPAQSGQVIALPTSAPYWLSRAEEALKAGDTRRALALTRRAAELEPDNAEVLETYARLLRQTDNYELSARVAFRALACEPGRYSLCALLGHDLQDVNRVQEAMDAYGHFLSAGRAAGDSAQWSEEYADVEDIVRGSLPDGGDARYLAVLDIVSRRLAAGDLSRARQALDLSEELPGRDSRRFVLRALLDQCEGRMSRALRWARIACRADPYSSQALCTLASIRMQRGDKPRAFAALMKAAPLCLYPGERQAVAAAALSMGLPQAACALATAACRVTPDRLAAHFDRAVVLMCAGQPEQAKAAAALCRVLDPGDVPSQCLEHVLSGLSTPAQARAAARQQPFYPGTAPAEAQERLLRLAEPLQEGLEPFCQLLQEDGALYETFLYALTLPGAGMGRLLGLVATALPDEFAERLLREALTMDTGDDDVKPTAAAALTAIGAQPPFVVRHGGRVAQLDPRLRQSSGASMEKQLLEKRLLDLWNQTCDSRLLTHALRLLHRMNDRELAAVAADAPLVFRTALEEHYARAYHLPDSARLRLLRARTAGSKRRVRLAYVKFCRLMPIEEEKKHGNH